MEHHSFLLEALKLAKERRGFCYPNPSVGAVVVEGNDIIAYGSHFAAGHPHAEVIACQNLPPNSIIDRILYVTLEPCCHWGRTPPCTRLILEKGIKKVFYGFKDPNPKVSGKGELFLRKQGVECQQISIPEVDQFYKSYSHWTLTQKPWVTCKLAISLDAKIADASMLPIAISGKEAQEYTHLCRLNSDAILTSARTILQDNPSLNSRLANHVIAKPLYILDSTLSLPLNAKIFETTTHITVFFSQPDEHKIKCLEERDVVCQQTQERNGKLDLESVISHIGLDGVHELWVEAGGQVFSTLVREHIAQKSIIYVAPKLLGGAAYPAFNDEIDIFQGAKKINWHMLGKDAVCEIEWI